MTSTGARTLGVGALAPALGTAAHVEAGGGWPEPTLPVVLVAFLTAGPAALVVRRRIGVVRLAVVLAAGQAAWHLTMGVGHAGHGMAPTAPSSGMVAAHVVVTVLVALGAAGADRAVSTMVATRLRAVLDLLGSRPAAVPPVPRRPAVAAPAAAPVTLSLLRVRPVRGPPERPAVA